MSCRTCKFTEELVGPLFFAVREDAGELHCVSCRTCKFAEELGGPLFCAVQENACDQQCVSCTTCKFAEELGGPFFFALREDACELHVIEPTLQGGLWTALSNDPLCDILSLRQLQYRIATIKEKVWAAALRDSTESCAHPQLEQPQRHIASHHRNAQKHLQNPVLPGSSNSSSATLQATRETTKNICRIPCSPAV